MDKWMLALTRSQETEVQSFERAVLDFSRAELEKTAGDFSEAMDSLLDTGNSTPRVDRLLEQTSAASRMGKSLAREQEHIKQAGIAGTVMGAIKPMAGKALGWAAKNPGHAMAAGGAAVGALGGAATAQPGHRLGGALGGAALGGAAGFGASKLPGGMGQKAMDYTSGAANMGLNRMGMQMKFASAKTAGMLSTGLGRAGAGALVGGAAGALHSSDAAKQGLAPAHHLRNAMLGAASGAALGGALHKMPLGGGAAGGVSAAEGALAKTHMPTGNTMAAASKPGIGMGHSPHVPAGTPAPGGFGQSYTPQDRQQMSRVRDNAQAAYAQREARHAAGIAPTRAASAPTAQPMAMAGTVPGKMKMAGSAFLKMAFSMSAQAEQGTPGGAQEPEESEQQLMPPGPPMRSPSKPAVELYGALKHLSPKTMRGLQVAQPGS